MSAVTGCGSGAPPLADSPTRTVETRAGSSERFVSEIQRTAPGDPAGARTAVAEFGLDLFRRVHEAEPNTLISPYSLYTVLAMARAGARGDTADQLDAVLRLHGPEAQGGAIAAVDAGIGAALAAAERMQQPIIITASNEAWVANGFGIRQDYLDQLARQFAVSAVAADFAGNPEQMRVEINAWVSERTNKLIPELFPERSIDSGTLLVLVNALYLKASWLVPFGPPVSGTFTTGTGKPVKVPMMSTGSRGPAATGGGWMAATVPYAGYGLQMTLLVPDPGRFADVVARLDGELLTAASAKDEEIIVTMPGFKVTSKPAVEDAVKELGVVDLFDSGYADLSGIAGQPGDLYATAFLHQATITVDRYGTEATAATALAVGAGGAASGPPRQLRIDRPFLFWIAETATGAPLFLGSVSDPS